VQDELLKRAAALRNDEQAASLAPGNERLLHRPAAGNDFVSGLDQAGFGRFEARSIERGRTGEVGPAAIGIRSLRAGAERARGRAITIRASALRPERATAGRVEGSIEGRTIGPGALEWLVARLDARALTLVPELRSIGPPGGIAASALVADRAIAGRRRASLPAAGPIRPCPESESRALRPGPVEARPVEARPIALGTAGPRSRPAAAITGRTPISGAFAAGAVIARPAPRPIGSRSIE